MLDMVRLLGGMDHALEDPVHYPSPRGGVWDAWALNNISVRLSWTIGKDTKSPIQKVARAPQSMFGGYLFTLVDIKTNGMPLYIVSLLAARYMKH